MKQIQAIYPSVLYPKFPSPGRGRESENKQLRGVQTTLPLKTAGEDKTLKEITTILLWF